VYLDAGKGKMKLPQTGGCLCGKIRYEISEAPVGLYMSLHRVPALNEQRVFNRPRRRRFSPAREKTMVGVARDGPSC
jgi:hypothetical protein